jgi:hypothetical protein
MSNERRQPSCGGTSRMTRECQVRFCERLGVQFPGPTRHSQPGRAISRSSHVHFAPKADEPLHRSEIRSTASNYSMILSAPIRSASGIVNPRLFAVLRLITSSNVVGCCTGMSSGRSPRNSRATCTATWR